MVALLGGISTPEMGHVRLQRHPADLSFTGICPYHHDCLEGLVAGPTFKARLGISGEDVPDNHPVWDIMAYYVAQAAVQVTAILRPQKLSLVEVFRAQPFLNGFGSNLQCYGTIIFQLDRSMNILSTFCSRKWLSYSW